MGEPDFEKDAWGSQESTAEGVQRSHVRRTMLSLRAQTFM